MKKILFICLLCSILPIVTRAQAHITGQDAKVLQTYHDSLTRIGRRIINNPNEAERKNANYNFIRTLVSALKVNNSFAYEFDSLKTISILKSPDNKFRIFSWFVMNEDGSYRFYGAMQMNSPTLVLHPLEDYSPLLKNPEDSVTDNRKWYGAEYYKIIPVTGVSPYYVLLGWKGNNVKSTKKVIEVLSFKNGKPVFGSPVLQSKGKTRHRAVFEYSRQASMLLRYIPEQNLIVFDHLAPPDEKLKDQPNLYGPDFTYDGYQLMKGKWILKENLDMRNVPSAQDVDIEDPKKQALRDRSTIPVRRN
ncbi:hypothetical protein KHS38_09810 [Mucilaginibacter sp. Bleaf8]|uniref:hypothetical protein n=1 Tax=Mucilaginibacter sp. Bleaf8 TaxID=2834430 RepID=UPI001BD0AFB5|nr:hypothetical protein [Mucilaginibacter sp. Bleaf8]MBS7564699.1 hypothetical protein [Mucilaginibacter sp. Bleaf8]